MVTLTYSLSPQFVSDVYLAILVNPCCLEKYIAENEKHVMFNKTNNCCHFGEERKRESEIHFI